MVSIVRISFGVVLIACAGLAGCSGNPSSSSAATAENSPTDTGASSAALAITGEPATVAAPGAEYSFRPATAGATGDALSFSVQNAPAWATFDPTTGTLAGTPSAADVGSTYSNVSIGVSDGAASAELAAFSITVTATEPVTLSWSEPTTNTNGSPSTNLSGYHVYYGTGEKSLTMVIAVGNADDTSYVFKNLTAGTWYFAVAALNNDNIESALSAVVKITI